jgi:MFS family permease
MGSAFVAKGLVVRHVSTEGSKANPLWMYCTLSGTVSLGYGSIYTLLADLRDKYHFSEAQLGLIAGAGFMAGLLAQLFLARLADRGRAAAMVRGGLIAATVAMLASSIATQFWAFLISRILLGLGSGAVSPAIRRIVVNASADKLGANLGRLAAFEISGFVLGPLVAAVAAQLFGLHAPFLFLAVVFFAALISCSWLSLSAGPRSDEPRVIRRLLNVPAMRAALASCVAFYVTIGTFEAVWAILLRDHGASTWLIGLTLSLFTVPMIFLAPVGGRMSQRRGPMRVAAVSITVATACTFSYGALPSLWMLLGVSLIHAFADSFTLPANQVAAAMAAPPGDASSGQGLLGATGLAAAGISGLASGYVYEHLGRAALFAGTAAVMACFLALALVFSKEVLRPVPAEALNVP